MYQSRTDRFWNVFWKIFGAVTLVLFAVSLIGGAVTRSADFASTLAMRTFAAAMGVCGFIAFVVVPVEMYFEDRRRRREDHTVK
jgi:O-antigen ligase